ncbi:MAG: efflux RND transporter periplasmic adaptor subunit [Burkholderiales bacterium]
MRSISRSGIALIASLLSVPFALAASSELASVAVQTGGGSPSASFDGTVEAVRQTVIAAQVPGIVVTLAVKAGDTVREGQVLARIDAREATQNSVASQAQVQAARSSLDVATKDYERQRHLLEKEYISQAAFERAEAQFHATSAQLTAQIAQAGAAHIQSDFFVIKAPYAGVIADVPVVQGDMAMPGKPLLTLYDPSALRVTASVPQTALSGFYADRKVKIELPGLPAGQQWLTRPTAQVLPTIDAGTHSAQMRVDLPPAIKSVAPGMFARVWLPNPVATTVHLYVPAAVVVRRAEMTGLYVIDPAGHPLLRQVRLGETQNGVVEVLAGVASGERVALDPQAAAKDRR